MSYKVAIKGQRRHNHLTKSEKKRIIRLTLSGTMTQVEIARAFGTHPQTIRLVCRAAGIGRFATLTRALEARAVEMLQTMSVPKVARALRLSRSKVKGLRIKYGIDPKRAIELSKLPLEKREAIAKAAREHEDFCVNVADKLKVHPQSVYKYAHAQLGPQPFRRGNKVEPMTSDFPQKSVRDEMALRIQRNMSLLADECRLSIFDEPQLVIIRSEDAAEIVNMVVRTSLEGQMPDDFVGLAKLLTERSIELIPRAWWNKFNHHDQGILTTRLSTEFLLATNALRKAATYESHVVH